MQSQRNGNAKSAVITGGTDAFWNIMNAALGRAKDGEGWASVVEPIFGNLIDSVDMKGLTKLLAKMPAGGAGSGGRKPIIEK